MLKIGISLLGEEAARFSRERSCGVLIGSLCASGELVFTFLSRETRIRLNVAL